MEQGRMLTGGEEEGSGGRQQSSRWLSLFCRQKRDKQRERLGCGLTRAREEACSSLLVGDGGGCGATGWTKEGISRRQGFLPNYARFFTFSFREGITTEFNTQSSMHHFGAYTHKSLNVSMLGINPPSNLKTNNRLNNDN